VAIPQRPFFPQSNAGHPSRQQASFPVLAVGRRVLVNGNGDGSRRVTLTDPTGTTATGLLADGTEVEILAWQPRGAGGTRYRIRATTGDVQGWLAAANLRPAPPPPEPVRRTPIPAPPAKPAPRTAAKKATRR
jgi:hypothetical protein